MIPGGAMPSRSSRPVLAAEGARRPPRRLAGTERRRAKNVTQSVVWSTCGPKVMEHIAYFEQVEKETKNESREGAKYITHSHILLTKNASEDVLAQPDRCHFVTFQKTIPNDVEMKMLKKYWK